MDAIVVKGLTKTFKTKIKQPGLKGSISSLFKPEYRHTEAVKSISFSIPKGQLVGFIGPNGAGKSTTLKILTGILYPSAGEASVLGMTPWRERKKLAYRIGSVFGQRSQLWWHLPPIDSFELFAAIYNLDEAVYKRRVAELVKTFEVKELLALPVRKLSLGERMRCELVAALLHEPDVLYLDEPSIGLDILAKKTLRDHIKAINKKGVTIILTSHDMDDIEEVCGRVILINHGEIVLDSSFERLRKSYLHKKVVKILLRKPARKLALNGITIRKENTKEVVLEVDTTILAVDKMLAKAVTHYDIEDIELTDPPIEEIIAAIYKEE